MRGTSAGETSASMPIRRVRFEDLCSSRWRLLARSRRSLPLPVTLKRFFVPLWVLFFGMVPCLLVVARAGRPSWLGVFAEIWGLGRGLVGVLGDGVVAGCLLGCRLRLRFGLLLV